MFSNVIYSVDWRRAATVAIPTPRVLQSESQTAAVSQYRRLRPLLSALTTWLDQKQKWLRAYQLSIRDVCRHCRIIWRRLSGV